MDGRKRFPLAKKTNIGYQFPSGVKITQVVLEVKIQVLSTIIDRRNRMQDGTADFRAGSQQNHNGCTDDKDHLNHRQLQKICVMAAMALKTAKTKTTATIKRSR